MSWRRPFGTAAMVAVTVCLLASTVSEAAPSSVVDRSRFGHVSSSQRANLDAVQRLMDVAASPPSIQRDPGSSPSQAAFRLLSDFGRVPTASEVTALRSLDQLDARGRDALSGTLAAFTRYRATATSALRSGAYGSRDLLDAKVDLVERAATLRSALRGVRASGACRSTTIFPVIAFSFGGCAEMHTVDVALSVDDGGNDIYRNNAGGGAAPIAVAAAFDFGGDDRYHGRDDWFSVGGENGGGYLGSGVLVDFGGDDEYGARGWGVNGGGGSGAGFLVDLAGRDRYLVRDLAGGAGGDRGAANGGAGVGSGFLADLEGNDLYDAGTAGLSGGVNGGAFGALLAWAVTAPASGFLFDGGGNDRYVASYFATNGGGMVVGDGMLVDAGGDDSYRAAPPSPPVGTSLAPELSESTNGGGAFGVGALIDLRGRDRYDDGVGPPAWDQTVVPKGTGKQVDVPG